MVPPEPGLFPLKVTENSCWSPDWMSACPGKSDSLWQFIGPLVNGVVGSSGVLEVEVVLVLPLTVVGGAENPSELGSLGSLYPGGGYGGGVGLQKYPEQTVPPQSVLFPLQVGPAG